MMHEFLSENRDEIIAPTRAKAAARSAPRPTGEALKDGAPLSSGQLDDKGCLHARSAGMSPR